MLYDRARLGSDACEMQRKIIHNDRKRTQSEFVTDVSNSQSIVSTMDRFVKAVNEMNDHVLLPTKLLDPDEESRGASADVPVMLRGRGNTRYDFYHCLNSIKKDLVLGVSSADEEEDSDDGLTDNDRTTPYKVLSTSSIHQQNVNTPTRRHSTTYAPNQRSQNKVLSTSSIHQQNSNTPTRRHSTTCAPYQRSQLCENLPTRKISLNNISYTENSLHSTIRQDNNSSAVNLVERQDSWASLNPLPEEQPTRKTGWSAITAIPEYHRQVTCDSGAECDESDPDTMSPVEIAEKLREHLQGLQIGFNHLTNTAKYITESIE